jgi:hypothetical protein
MGEMMMGEGMGMGRGPQPFAPAGGSTFKADFNSDATVIDLRGGERLSGRGGTALTAPGEILLLDADGFLVVRDELDDKSAREQVENPTQPNAGNMGVPMMEMPLRGRVPGI